MYQPNYRITPSILNKFQSLLDYSMEFEGPFNRDSEGNYKLSEDEVIEKLEQELIDSINRVDKEHHEAADKGTAFGEVIDRIILHKKDGLPEVECHSSKTFSNGVDELEWPCIIANIHEFTFSFDLGLCMNMARKFNGAVPQYLCSSNIVTKYGDVELYGYSDYILRDKVIDLKTTKMYNFPKYNRQWQWRVYPFCLVESGMMKDVSEFEYSIVKWTDKVGQPSTGEIYSEVYTYRHEKAKSDLREICTMFIEWLELNREKITDRKIFGGEEH